MSLDSVYSILPVIACFSIAFAIGSNDTSNSFGICIGCGVLSMKRATFLLIVLVFLGFVLAGEKVMKTVGSELTELDAAIVSTSLLLSSMAIVSANHLKTPVSSHQAIVASLVGSALAVGRSVHLDVLFSIVLSWILSPFGAMMLSVAIYKAMEMSISRLPAFGVERVVRFMLILSGSVVAFNTGANELATALAPAVRFGAVSVVQAAVIGALMLFTGAVIVSHRVVETVGKGITTLDPYSGLAAQLGAGLTVLLFTFLGMPVSTTFCVVGAVSGIGLFKGLRGIKIAFLRRIMLSWIATPVASFVAAYVVTLLILLR